MEGADEREEKEETILLLDRIDEELREEKLLLDREEAELCEEEELPQRSGSGWRSPAAVRCCAASIAR